MNREDEHPYLGHETPQLTQRVHSRLTRHIQVQNHDIGNDPLDYGQRGDPIIGLADHRYVVRVPEQNPQTFADHAVVVDPDNRVADRYTPAGIGPRSEIGPYLGQVIWNWLFRGRFRGHPEAEVDQSTTANYSE
jgi:hypothetical protein